MEPSTNSVWLQFAQRHDVWLLPWSKVYQLAQEDLE